MCWRALLCVTALLILSLFYSPPRLAAQAITGDILGTVKDPNGAVVPKAKVVLAEMATGITLTAMTDDSANYLFAQLKPGRYRVDVSKEGFQTTSVSDINLLVGQRPGWDMSLLKNIPLRESVALQLRFDAFTVLNHTQFTDYNTTISFSGLTNPVPTNLPFDSCGNLVNAKNGFGAVNGVRPPRIIQLVARFVF
jgi:Carboxypeptidase regulatory-like domain